MKKLISLLLALVLSLSLTAPALAAPTSVFSDVPTTHWSYPYVERAYNAGIMLGTYYDAQSGRRLFSPNADISCAEWSVILARSFYEDEVAIEPDIGGSWYDRQVKVLQYHNIYADLGVYSLLKPLNRYQMAQMIGNFMTQYVREMPTEVQLRTIDAKITDLTSVPAQYKQAVRSCYYLEIITGTGDGSFAGTMPMSRAQAATVWARLVDKVDEMADTHYGSVVGSISTEKVTLSPETHHWAIDYWSMQPESIRSVADQDAFNCAVQTRIDTHKIQNEGEWEQSRKLHIGENYYYNYAVLAGSMSTGTQEMRNVGAAMLAARDSKGTYGSIKPRNQDFIYFTVAPTYGGTDLETFNAAIAPTLAKITDRMTDKQKVEICVQAVCDRIDYEAGEPSTNWLSGPGAKGNCVSYQTMIGQLLSAVDIPTINVGGTVAGGGHAWLQVKVDGEWMIVDGTLTELGYASMFTFADHENAYSYDHSLNEGASIRIARAIIDYPIAD